MELLFILTKDNMDIAMFELDSIIESKIGETQVNTEYGIVIADTYKEVFSRLAYTNFVYEVLFVSEKEELAEKMKKYSWQKHYEQDFWLKIINLTDKKTDITPTELADIIWNKVDNPIAKKDNPKTVFDIIFADKIYVCKLIWENEKEFNNRKPHMRPMLHPSSLSPKLARACINMTGIKKGIILDPFCGTGGFLIEAALMGLRSEGIDIDKKMIIRAKANLEYYKIKNAKLTEGDALKIDKKYEYIVTDLPYAKNTKNTNLKKLYAGFLKRLESVLEKRAVVIFPDFIDYKKLIKTTKVKLKIIKEFDYYIHKSMTKKIVVIEKNII